MRFYNRDHKSYCGVDLHARTMYLCYLCMGVQLLLGWEIRCVSW
jgi:hypothetical protein